MASVGEALTADGEGLAAGSLPAAEGDGFEVGVEYASLGLALLMSLVRRSVLHELHSGTVCKWQYKEGTNCTIGPTGQNFCYNHLACVTFACVPHPYTQSYAPIHQ
jgi:hypothetical protein